MVTIFNNLNLGQLQSSGERNLSNLLKVGQQLNVNIQKIEGNQVQMQIGNQLVSAQTQDKSLSTGPARVQVMQTQPQLVVAISENTANKLDSKALQTQLLQQTLRQLMPNQTALSQTFQQLGQIGNLPAPLQLSLQSLLDQIKKTTPPSTGKNLKENIDNSGQFMESKLKQSPAGKNPQNFQFDIKAQLHKLLAQAQSSETQSPQVKQLSQNLIQAINRISYHQLSQIENPMAYNFEFLGEVNQQLVEEQLKFKKSKQGHSDKWQVWLQLQLPEGILQSKVSLKTTQKPTEDPAKSIVCLLWCENASLHDKISQQHHKLQQKLERIGIEKIDIHLSQQPLDFDPSQGDYQKVSLIDIKI